MAPWVDLKWLEVSIALVLDVDSLVESRWNTIGWDQQQPRCNNNKNDRYHYIWHMCRRPRHFPVSQALYVKYASAHIVLSDLTLIQSFITIRMSRKQPEPLTVSACRRCESLWFLVPLVQGHFPPRWVTVVTSSLNHNEAKLKENG